MTSDQWANACVRKLRMAGPKSNSHRKDALMDIELFLVVGTILLVSGLVTAIVNRMLFPGQLAEIEQLRRDAAGLEATASHEVMGQVAKCNQEIASCKRYRGIWWSAVFYPKQWEEVQEIEMPRARDSADAAARNAV